MADITQGIHGFTLGRFQGAATGSEILQTGSRRIRDYRRFILTDGTEHWHGINHYSRNSIPGWFYYDLGR